MRSSGRVLTLPQKRFRRSCPKRIFRTSVAARGARQGRDRFKPNHRSTRHPVSTSSLQMTGFGTSSSARASCSADPGSAAGSAARSVCNPYGVRLPPSFCSFCFLFAGPSTRRRWRLWQYRWEQPIAVERASPIVPLPLPLSTSPWVIRRMPARATCGCVRQTNSTTCPRQGSPARSVFRFRVRCRRHRRSAGWRARAWRRRLRHLHHRARSDQSRLTFGGQKPHATMACANWNRPGNPLTSASPSFRQLPSR